MKRRHKPHRTDFSPVRIVWHEHMAKLLGKIPDTKLAKLMRVTDNAVRDERIRRRIPPSTIVPRIDWTPEAIGLLGKDSDKRVADALGASRTHVGFRRRTLGIPAFYPSSGTLELSAREIAMLGKSPDGVVAKRIGLSPGAITVKRRELGIPPFVSHPPVRWTKQMLALLARETNRAVAKKFGIGTVAVARKRAELGIPSRSHGWVERTAAVGQELARFRDHEVMKRLGSSAGTVRRLRADLGVPSPHPYRYWTDDEIQLLGTMSDGDLAKRLRISKSAVVQKRKQGGIPKFIPPTRRALLSVAIADRLGKESDSSIARELGVSTWQVRNLRQRLGVKASVRKWTPAEQALLGTAPDEDVAAALGIPRSSVSAQRESRRIPAFRRPVPA